MLFFVEPSSITDWIFQRQSQQLTLSETPVEKATPLFPGEPTRSPLDTSDWNVYTNQKYKYQISRPPNWLLQEISDGYIQLFDPRAQEQNPVVPDVVQGAIITITVIPNQSLSFFDSISPEGKREDVVIGGQPGIKREAIELGIGDREIRTVEVFILRDDTIYHLFMTDLERLPEYKNVFDSMISTLKFSSL